MRMLAWRRATASKMLFGQTRSRAFWSRGGGRQPIELLTNVNALLAFRGRYAILREIMLNVDPAVWSPGADGESAEDMQRQDARGRAEADNLRIGKTGESIGVEHVLPISPSVTSPSISAPYSRAGPRRAPAGRWTEFSAPWWCVSRVLRRHLWMRRSWS
ncbi:MAG TPA: hypothetical protein VGE65_08905 [Sphingobium sp.]